MSSHTIQCQQYLGLKIRFEVFEEVLRFEVYEAGQLSIAGVLEKTPARQLTTALARRGSAGPLPVQGRNMDLAVEPAGRYPETLYLRPRGMREHYVSISLSDDQVEALVAYLQDALFATVPLSRFTSHTIHCQQYLGHRIRFEQMEKQLQFELYETDRLILSGLLDKDQVRKLSKALAHRVTSRPLRVQEQKVDFEAEPGMSHPMCFFLRPPGRPEHYSSVSLCEEQIEAFRGFLNTTVLAVAPLLRADKERPAFGL